MLFSHIINLIVLYQLTEKEQSIDLCTKSDKDEII